MSNSIRYFQLTSDILLEYDYTTTSIFTEDGQSGDVSDVMIDLRGNDTFSVVGNDIDSSTYFYVNDVSSNSNYDGIYADRTNFVIPLNRSCSKFIKYVKYNSYNDTYTKYVNDSYKDEPYYTSDDDYTGNSESDDNGVVTHSGDMDVVFDKIRLHFTSRNFMGDYNGIIIQAYIYNYIKKKINLLSLFISRLSDLKLNPEPMLINQKLYTTYIDAKILSTDCLLYSGNGNDGENEFKPYIIAPGTRLMKNTPILFDIYGVKSNYDINGYDAYLTEKINNVVVPNKDSYNNVYVTINESSDGDYYEIEAKATGYDTFSEFIESLDEHPESYIIMHDLLLREYYVGYQNSLRTKITHREQYVMNATTDTDDGLTEINTDQLDDVFNYRPICVNGSSCIKFTIEDTLKIVDTYSNTTIVKKAKCDCTNPYKYGKHMSKIYLGEVPSQINVYNKRSSNLKDEDIDSITFSTNPSLIKITGLSDLNSGSSSGLSVNNIGITAFCESANIRIIPTELLR